MAVQPQYHFAKANVVVSLESDFLFAHPASLRYARQFTNARRVAGTNELRLQSSNQAAGSPSPPPRGPRSELKMNRLYVAESSPTITGAMAEHRLPIGARRIEALGYALAQRLGLTENPNAPPRFDSTT